MKQTRANDGKSPDFDPQNNGKSPDFTPVIDGKSPDFLENCYYSSIFALKKSISYVI